MKQEWTDIKLILIIIYTIKNHVSDPYQSLLI